VKPALFSANSEGACPNCNGAGVIYTDLAMMAGVATTCEECEGKRFQASVLDLQRGGQEAPLDRPKRIGVGRAVATSPDRAVERPAHGRPAIAKIAFTSEDRVREVIHNLNRDRMLREVVKRANVA
jgi:hypothetical protein